VPTINKSESSRINGAKSRGPVTPEGKQRSSLNAVRHGLLAKSICLTNEDPEKFKELLQDYLTRLQPTDNVELRLVEQLASAAFRLERFAGAETALFDLEMDTQTPQIEKQFKKIDHACTFALAFKSLADNSKALHLYLRYETTISRQYDRALKQLLALRANFPIPTEADVPNEAEIPNEPEVPNEPSGPDERRASALPDEPNDEPATTNDERRASALPNEPNDERATTNDERRASAPPSSFTSHGQCAMPRIRRSSARTGPR